jgi:hypothetical protein
MLLFVGSGCSTLYLTYSFFSLWQVDEGAITLGLLQYSNFYV